MCERRILAVVAALVDVHFARKQLAISIYETLSYKDKL